MQGIAGAHLISSVQRTVLTKPARLVYGKHPIQGGEHAHLDIIGSLPELGSRVKTENETAERAKRWQF